MKRAAFVVLCLAIIGFANTVRAQSFAEFEVTHADGTWEPLTTAWVVKEVDSKNALTIWALTSRTWGETLVGYQRTVTPWCQAGIGIGLETDKDLWRVNPWLWVGKGRLSAYGTFEEGASGFWYLAKGGAKVHKRFTIGIYSRKFVGTGGYTEVQVEKRTSILTAVTRHQGKTQVVVALHRAF